MPQTCIERFTISQDNTYLDEIRGKHKVSLHDWHPVIKAEAIESGKHVAASCTKDYTIDGAALFYFSPASKAMVVNQDFFGDLTVADAPRVFSGKKQKTIGRIKPAALKGMPSRQLVRFLLAASAVQTYWHLQADLCLVREEQRGGAYTAHFSGVHLYFTNEKNEDAYSFSVTISADGEVVLAGSPASK